MSPPNWVEIILQIQSPRPMPFLFKFLSFSTVPNNLNNFFWSLLLMPSPVSLTATLMYFSLPLLLSATIILISPSSVYFIAFDSRLRRTYCSLSESVLTSKSFFWRSSPMKSNKIGIPALDAWYSSTSTTSCTAFLRLKLCTSFLSLFILIYWKSRRSLTKNFSSLVELFCILDLTIRSSMIPWSFFEAYLLSEILSFICLSPSLILWIKSEEWMIEFRGFCISWHTVPLI